jgi:hypothetical protein
MAGFGLTFWVIMVVLALLKCATAYCVARRRHRVFCMAVAALSCLSIPFGLALGVLTLLTLSRRSVAGKFEV